MEKGILDRARIYVLHAYGFATEPGKRANLRFWRHERMPLPVAYLADVELVGRLQEALKVAEAVGEALRRSTWLLASLALAPGETRKPERADVKRLAGNLAPERLYWAGLEVPFQSFFLRLAQADAEQADNELIAWARLLGSQAREAFRRVCEGLERSVRFLKATTEAERDLRQRLYGGKRGVLRRYMEALETG